MDINKEDRICPVEQADMLDFSLRKLVHNPRKILAPYIKEGMTVLDLGCGPGFFTIEIAKLVGNIGKVVAADLQQGMLEKLKVKIQNTEFQNIIELHKCQKDTLALSEKFDFILLFYMLHEVPDQASLFQEIKTLLKPDGKVFIVEPKIHVSKANFQRSKNILEQTGFEIEKGPNVFFSRSLIARN